MRYTAKSRFVAAFATAVLALNSIFPSVASASELASETLDVSFKTVSGRKISSTEFCNNGWNVAIRDVATFWDKVAFTCQDYSVMVADVPLDGNPATTVDLSGIDDDYPGDPNANAAWEPSQRFFAKDGRNLYFYRSRKDSTNSNVAIRFFRLNVDSGTVVQVGNALLWRNGNGGYSNGIFRPVLLNGMLYVPRVGTDGNPSDYYTSAVDLYSVSWDSLTFATALSVPEANSYLGHIHVMEDDSIRVAKWPGNTTVYDLDGSVSDLWGGKILHPKSGNSYDWEYVSTRFDSITYDSPEYALLLSAGLNTRNWSLYRGFVEAVDLGASILYQSEFWGFYDYRKTGENRFFGDDGEYVSWEIQLWESLWTAYVEVASSVPPGTSFTFEIASGKAVSEVFSSSDTSGGGMVMGWMDTLDRMGGSVCEWKGQLFSPGTRVVIGTEEFTVYELMDYSSGFEARLLDSSWNPAMLDGFFHGKSVSVESVSYQSVPVQSLDGKTAVSLGAGTSSVWYRIRLQADASDMSKTPRIAKVAFMDSPAPDSPENPGGWDSETPGSVTVSRSALADAVLNYDGLSTLVSNGRSNAVGDEQRAKAAKYATYLSSQAFSSAVAAAWTAKVQFIDLSLWDGP